MQKREQKNFWLRPNTIAAFEKCLDAAKQLTPHSIDQCELANAALDHFMSLPIDNQAQIVSDWFAGRFRP